MNNSRRKQIRSVIKRLVEIQEEISSIADDEQEYYDEAPENLQMSERYERAEEVAGELEGLSSEIEDLCERLEETM